MARFAAAVGLLAFMAACGGFTTDFTSVRITRTAGSFVLPAIDQTITDASTVNRLASDIEALPPFPSGTMFCPIDFGTSYRLVFKGAGARTWTATVSAQGCQGVDLSDGRVLWALDSPTLFTELGAALGLAPEEVIPRPCPALPGNRCYPQPVE